MSLDPKPVCDIRYSINYFPNSVTAAEVAAEDLGYRRVLFDVLYSPAVDEDDEDCFLLPPPLTPEYDLLVNTPWSTWYYDYVINRQFTVPDLFDEIVAVSGIDEYWMCLKSNPEFVERALIKLAESLPSEIKGIIVSAEPLPVLPEGLYGCDPSGTQKFKLISRPSSISEDAALIATPSPILANTFAVDGHPSSEYRAESLP